mmetsp:Transcript_69593/g.216062  ORF Transcript_69593/g.216062 Transcript_69593/m.216062 type:complete len:328 (-) Transcript_69593:7-990(-)
MPPLPRRGRASAAAGQEPLPQLLQVGEDLRGALHVPRILVGVPAVGKAPAATELLGLGQLHQGLQLAADLRLLLGVELLASLAIRLPGPVVRWDLRVEARHLHVHGAAPADARLGHEEVHAVLLLPCTGPSAAHTSHLALGAVLHRRQLLHPVPGVVGCHGDGHGAPVPASHAWVRRDLDLGPVGGLQLRTPFHQSARAHLAQGDAHARGVVDYRRAVDLGAQRERRLRRDDLGPQRLRRARPHGAHDAEGRRQLPIPGLAGLGAGHQGAGLRRPGVNFRAQGPGRRRQEPQEQQRSGPRQAPRPGCRRHGGSRPPCRRTTGAQGLA